MSDQGVGLRASFAIRRGDLALDIDVALPVQGVTVLFGASGVGKTSCLRAIAGLDPVRGYVSFRGETWQDGEGDPLVPAHRRRVGYVFQEPSLLPHLSVEGNLEYGFRRAGRPARMDRERWIDSFGVRPLLGRRVHALSGGERQRVAIVRALLSDPQLLLFDEPLSALDAKARQELLASLESLRATLGIPMIYVSHSAEEVARLADQLVLLDGGRVVAQGALLQMLARLDLPSALAEALGAVVEGRVTAVDVNDGLLELAFNGGRLWLPRRQESVGHLLRCRVDARDVVIMRDTVAATSALNQIACRVEGVADTDHPSQCLVQLSAGDTRLFARITWRSWHELGLLPGCQVWAQVKAVALGG
ncbi:molybdenum ABC transporter ATP-binding protein [Dyella sp. 20L07]|uniref:molybdenum ABC transporter ATP-binding protein n=1 Tax=Dyella sp. 20L07 TaxID=3384240 RepID=UPI003D27C444